MRVFEITVQRKDDDAWPIVVRHQPGAHELALWSRGRLNLDLKALAPLLPSRKEYGLLLGKALFQADIRDAFVRAVADAKTADEPLRVLLNVEAEDLRRLHWEQLHGPLDHGWDYLLLNQGTPFSLYLPSQIQLRFPPIGRRDLRALLLVAGPEELEGDYGLPPFDTVATVGSIRHALGEIPCDVLAPVDGALGSPTLKALCEHLTAGRYTLLHVVCHGAYLQDASETVLYFPKDANGRPVPATTLIGRLSRLAPLPHLNFFSTCESADPQAEAGLGGLGQRLVRELGMPAVVAMTDRISIDTAEALASAFYGRLCEHGEVDRALCEALASLQGRHDVTVPALFSRLGGRALWSDTLDRPLTETEIRYGLERLPGLLEQRAPVLLPEFEDHSTRILASLGTEAAALSTETRRERDAALTAVNQLCSEALDLSFNALALGQTPPDYDARCPFPGLSAFGARFLATGEVEQDDREFFFGREALIERLRNKLAEHSFLPILGPSGSGKSSLVVAGLIPALQEEEPPLQMAYMTPGSDPRAQLRAALKAARRKRDGKPAVLVVDQFEELFTLCTDEGERQTFLDRLLALADEMRVVITMRADFWGDCALYPALRAEMQAWQELIAPMDASELRAAMEQQAEKVGLRFEADLSNTILDDVRGEPGAMPLLQHALLELWNRRHGRWLLAEEYRDGIGGVQKAIAHTADDLYKDLAPDDQVRMRDIFLRLTRLADAPAGAEARDTRRRVGLAELVPAGSEPAETVALVKRLADARLVVTTLNAASGQEEVEVAHEALIRYWPRLRGWLNEDRAELHLREGVREAALEWEAHEQDEAYLVHRGGRLEDLEALSKLPRFTLNELEQAYVGACVDLRERERREKEAQQRRELKAARRWAAVIGAVGVVAIVLAVLATCFWRQAESNAELARARELIALSTNQLDGRLDQALLLAIEAFRRENLPQAHQALFQAWGHKPQLSRFLHEHTAPVQSVVWSADGRLASGSWDNTVIVWDLKHGRAALTLQGHGDEVYNVAWSADGRLASGSKDGTVIIWDLEHGRPAQTLEGHAASFWSMAWSADGRLASDSYDDTVIVWDVEHGLPAQTLEGHTDTIWSVAWSADRRLASGSSDNTVIIWDLESGLPAQTLEGHTRGVTSVAWSADGQLASGSYDGTVIVWDVEHGLPAQTLEGHTRSINSVAWSADGRLVSSSNDNTIMVWDLKQGLPAQTLEGHTRGVTSVAWSADGQLASGAEDNTVIVWDPERGLPAKTLEGHGSWVLSVAWSADGRLASGAGDFPLVVWDLSKAGLERGLPVQTLEEPDIWVESVAWSADGRLASGGGYGVIVWDLERGLPAQTLEGHTASVHSVAWSADGRLASSDGDSTIIVWDLEHGRPAQTLGGRPLVGTSLAWSADGRLASGGGHGVIVWDLEHGQAAQTLEGHRAGVRSVAWSADGRLASGSEDNSVIVWDLERGLPAHILEGHGGWVLSVAWSVDGQLAFGSYDKTVQIWQMEPEEWLRQACYRAGRNLTQAEWRLYFPDEAYRKTCEEWPEGK